MRRGAAAVAAVTSVVVAAASAHGYVGELDPGFSEDGVVRLGRASSALIATGPDGGVFALTQSFSKEKGTTTVLRLYSSDGSVTPDFAGDGSATPRLPGRGEVRDMGMDSEGRLLLLGDARRPFVTRLTTSGRIDRTFADQGIRRLTPAGSFARDLTLDSRDRVVVLTTAFSRDRSSADAFVTRLRRGGAWDRDFGANGIRRIDMQRYDYEAALDTDAQNRPVVGGVGSRLQSFKLVRLTEDRGRLDPSFSDDGVARAHFGSSVDFVAVTVVRADTGVTLGGAISDSGSRAVAWRVDSDGNADTGFGDDGKVRFSAGDSQQHAATAVDDAGAVIATGHVSTSRTSAQPLVAAVLPDGSPDIELGPNGHTPLSVGSGLAEAGLAFAIDQQLVLLVRSRMDRGDRRVTLYEMVRLAQAPGGAPASG